MSLLSDHAESTESDLYRDRFSQAHTFVDRICITSIKAHSPAQPEAKMRLADELESYFFLCRIDKSNLF